MMDRIFALVRDEDGNQSLFSFPCGQKFEPHEPVPFMRFRDSMVFPVENNTLSVDDFMVVPGSTILVAKDHVHMYTKDCVLKPAVPNKERGFTNKNKYGCAICYFRRHDGVCAAKGMLIDDIVCSNKGCYSFADSLTMEHVTDRGDRD